MPNNLGIAIFAKFDGVDGEATDSGHTKWCVVKDISHKIEQPTASTTGSGEVTSGAPKIGDFTLTKYLDVASPKLHEMACTGKKLPKLTVDLMRSMGDKMDKNFEVVITDVYISNVELASNGNDDRPTETVACRGGTITWTYSNGQGNTAGGFDIAAGKKK
jgi:type VI secretion system secreted protein Hcp